jgi:hypothetical protein
MVFFVNISVRQSNKGDDASQVVNVAMGVAGATIIREGLMTAIS